MKTKITKRKELIITVKIALAATILLASVFGSFGIFAAQADVHSPHQSDRL